MCSNVLLCLLLASSAHGFYWRVPGQDETEKLWAVKRAMDHSPLHSPKHEQSDFDAAIDSFLPVVPEGSSLQQQLLREGLLRHGSAGEAVPHPRVSCVQSNFLLGQAPKLTECKSSKYQAVACNAVVDEAGAVIYQGCVVQSDLDFFNYRCQKQRCDISNGTEDLPGHRYCCCFGDSCNAKPAL